MSSDQVKRDDGDSVRVLCNERQLEGRAVEHWGGPGGGRNCSGVWWEANSKRLRHAQETVIVGGGSVRLLAAVRRR